MRQRLTQLDSLRPWPLRPRGEDPTLVELLTISLRALGQLLPVFVTRDNLVIDGWHRCQAVAKLGWDYVVTRTLPHRSERELVARCLALNNATIDVAGINLDALGMPGDLSQPGIVGAKARAAFAAQAAKQPSLETRAERYPCLQASYVSAERIRIGQRADEGDQNLRRARMVDRLGCRVPVVVTPCEMTVVHGVGRVRQSIERGMNHVEITTLHARHDALARVALNQIVGTWALTEPFAEVIRPHAIQLRRSRSAALSSVVEAAGFYRGGPPNLIRLRQHRSLATLEDVSQLHVLDFGSGLGYDAACLRRAGVDVDVWEPFPSRKYCSRIDRVGARDNAREFLELIARGKRWNVILGAGLLHALPFERDQIAVATLLAALADTARVVVSGYSRHHTGYRGIYATSYAHAAAVRSQAVPFPAIAGGVFTELLSAPRLTKYWTAEEMRRLWAGCFRRVVISTLTGQQVLLAKLEQPYRPKRESVLEAARHEFDLPLGDGERLGLADEAEAAFLRRFWAGEDT